MRALISDGRIEGSKEAGRWFVDPQSLDRWNAIKSNGGRPLGPRNAWGALFALSGREVPWLRPWDKSRLRHRLQLEDPEVWLPSVRNRAFLHRFHGHPGVIDRLSQEPALVLSGISAAPHYKLDVFPRKELEAYVSSKQLKRLQREYRLESSDRPNVLLRSVEDAWPFRRDENPAPAAVVAIDLLESADERSRRAGSQLWKRVIGEKKRVEDSSR